MIYPVRGAPKRIKGIKETSPAILMRLYRSCLSTIPRQINFNKFDSV